MDNNPYNYEPWKHKLAKDKEDLLAQQDAFNDGINGIMPLSATDESTYEVLLDQWHERRGKIENIDAMVENLETNRYLR